MRTIKSVLDLSNDSLNSEEGGGRREEGGGRREEGGGRRGEKEEEEEGDS
jgi:hypothetical protein